MDFPDHPLPSVPWVFETMQLTRHFVEVSLQDDMRIQKAKATYTRYLDQKSGKQKAFAQVRGPGPPPVTQVAHNVSFAAIVVSQDDLCCHDVFASALDLAELSCGFPVLVGDCPCQLVSSEVDFCTVQSCTPLDLSGDSIQVSQHQLAISPTAVVDALNSYWKPIWQRDSTRDVTEVLHSAHQFQEFLDQVPQQPEIKVDLMDMAIWSHAISKLKASSARGSDGISAAELKLLPEVAIHALAHVFSTSARPFDSDVMHGLIAPLSKTGQQVPTKDRTRPITILPQLYRLWASVICIQLTASLATWVPSDICGFLPHRGAVQSVVISQFHLEWSRWKRIGLSGLVLDLQKCFNTFDWSFAVWAMRRCGIPVWLLEAWIHAQCSLTRWWLLQGQLYHAGHASTGFPEGDQWSVLAMICISVVWIFFVRSLVQSPDSLTLSCFADNWSWTVENHLDHKPLLDGTSRLANAAGVSIDWNKTWFWTSLTSLVPLVSACLAEIAPCPVRNKCSAPDLGFQMQYGLSNQLGILAERLQTGLSRLARLAAMEYPLSVKEHMLVSSVYPSALHGSEVKPPSGGMFHKLRAAAARALFGNAVTLSSSIALLFGSSGIIDPEYWFLCKLFATVRRLLAKLDPGRVLDFFHLASHFTGSLHQVHGPAASLGFCLRSLGWQLDSHGVLRVGSFLALDFCTCSLPRLKRFLDEAWQYQHVKTFTSRFSWYQYPDISVSDTRAVLALFQDPQRKLLVREIAGGYQLSGQKAHWLEHEDGSCVLCGGVDGRVHRLMECPAGAAIREPFLSVLDSVVDQGSTLLEFPAVLVYPQFEALQVLHFGFQLPQWDQDVLQVLENMLSVGSLPRFYTDGSCQFPTVRTTRYAASAVVLDLCTTDTERAWVADSCRYEGDFTRTFQVLSACPTPGEQDILRAEIAAICIVCENFREGIIFTDSQTALVLVTLALRASTVEALISKDHLDLLVRIWSRREVVNFRIEKVKSHSGFSEIAAALDRYHAMGNAFADQTAVSAREDALPALAKEHQRLQQEIEADKDALYAVFNLHLQLLADRGRKLAKEKVDIVPGHDFSDIWRAFRTWTVDRPVFLPADATLDLLRFCSWGEDIARMTYTWLKELKWPDEDTGPLSYKPGTTWIELGVSWMTFHSCYLPVLRQDVRGDKRVIHLRDFDEAKEHSFTWTEAGTVIEKIIGNVQALLPEPVFPVVKRVKVSSLYNLGAPAYYQGFNRRVQLPSQSNVFDWIQTALQGISGKGLQATPELSPSGPCFGTLPDTWKVRCTKSLTAMAKARVARKRLNQ